MVNNDIDCDDYDDDYDKPNDDDYDKPNKNNYYHIAFKMLCPSQHLIQKQKSNQYSSILDSNSVMDKLDQVVLKGLPIMPEGVRGR